MKDKSNKNTMSDGINRSSGFAAVPVRPQKIKDSMGHGGGTFTPGVAPAGGFQSVWNFSNCPTDYKNSPSTKPNKSKI